MAKMPNNIRMQ